MNEILTSASWPNGVKLDRTEAEARASMNMSQVISFEGSRASRLKEVGHRSCAWCGTDPLPAALVCGRYVVCCENDDCKIDVQATGASPEEAFAIWDARI